MQINIWGTDGATECRKVWAIKEEAQRCGHKRRECIFPRKRWEKGEQAGKGETCVVQQEKGSLVRSEIWHKEKSKIKQENMEALGSGGGFHFFPGHCAVQSGQRNLPSLIPSLSSSPLPSSSLTHQVLPWPCSHRNTERSHSPLSTCVKQPKSSTWCYGLTQFGF